MRLYKLLIFISLIISSVSLTLSVIAFWSSCSYEYNEGNAIMSAFSIIVSVLIGAVTILIAWQVYNHFVAKDEVKKMIEDEVPRVAMDIGHVLESIDKAGKDVCLLTTADIKDYDKIEAYINGLEIAKTCNLDSLKTYAIDYTLNRFHRFYNRLKESDERHIRKGCRNSYLFTCNNIKHPYIDDLKEYIKTAKEVE